MVFHMMALGGRIVKKIELIASMPGLLHTSDETLIGEVILTIESPTHNLV